jgi:hypothetical protein
MQVLDFRYRPIADVRIDGMDDPAYRLLQAWMLACEADAESAQLITEQFQSGRISPEQAIGALHGLYWT